MRKVILSFGLAMCSVAVAVTIGLKAVGMSPTNFSANIGVGTGMGAKLACSGHFLSGFDEDQIRDDLASFSPAIDLFNITLDEQAGKATVDLLGLFNTSATYRKGIGCTLDQSDTTAIDGLEPPAVPKLDRNSLWPAGPRVRDPDSRLFETLFLSLTQDQEQGLQTRALIMVQSGRIVAEVYAPEITPDTPLMGWSQGKSLTALMLGWLEQHGLISVLERNLFPQ